MSCRICLLCAATVVGIVGPALGNTVTYEFVGEVTQTEAVFGLDVALGSLVTGRISYEFPDTVPDHSEDGYHLYTESIGGGFTANFITSGAIVEVRAGDYAVQVRDKTDGDGFSAVYSPSSRIPPTEPATIGSDEYTNVDFRLDFIGFPFLYSSSSVPASLAVGDFPIFKLGSLAESDSLGSILFDVTGLQQVPEPSSLLLLAYGSGVLACVLLRRKRIGRPRLGRG